MRPRNARAPRDVARRGAEPVLLMELQTAHCAGPALIQGGTVHGSSDVLLKPTPPNVEKLAVTFHGHLAHIFEST